MLGPHAALGLQLAGRLRHGGNLRTASADPLVNPGDVLRRRCVYDNSLNNPALAAALAERGLSVPVDVALGEDTLDEMCLAAIGIIYPNPQP